MKDNWSSKHLSYSNFTFEEASLVQSLFEKNIALQERDPTFQKWKKSVYHDLIIRSCECENFFLKKVSINNTDEVIGYFQLERDVRQKGKCWIPMLTITPQNAGKGFGREIVDSIVEVLTSTKTVTSIGIQVYVENTPALHFWHKCGFNHIEKVHSDNKQGQHYQSLILSMTI